MCKSGTISEEKNSKVGKNRSLPLRLCAKTKMVVAVCMWVCDREHYFSTNMICLNNKSENYHFASTQSGIVSQMTVFGFSDLPFS